MEALEQRIITSARKQLLRDCGVQAYWTRHRAELLDFGRADLGRAASQTKVESQNHWRTIYSQHFLARLNWSYTQGGESTPILKLLKLS